MYQYSVFKKNLVSTTIVIIFIINGTTKKY